MVEVEVEVVVVVAVFLVILVVISTWLDRNAKGVRKAGEKVKVMISTLKEQASETDDPDLQVRGLAPTIHI